MIKIMIVEDEVLVRTGLRTLVEWKKNGFEICKECSNGEEALVYLKQHKVDIILTDIRMPKLDGISLIEEIRNCGYNVEIIILSSYDDFEFAKKAMVLGVRNYIHKPTMLPEEIIDTLKKIEKEIYSKRESADIRNQQEIDKNRKIAALCSIAAKAMLCIDLEDEYDQFSESGTEKRFDVFIMKTIGKRTNNNGIEDKIAIENNLYYLWEEKYKDYEGLACLSREDEYYIGICDDLFPVSMIEEIYSCIKDKEGSVVVYKSAGRKSRYNNLYDVIVYLKKEVDELFKYENWIFDLNPIVAEAIKIIREFYNTNITLYDIANKIHINASYLSRLFMKDINMSFVNYLTDVRINKAKELLINSDMTIHEIADKVGYTNEKYFMILFKKQTGLTPGYYRSANS